MSANSKIEWTTHTFNPWIGCTKVSAGCAHCYAETLNKRLRGGKNWGRGAPRQRTSASYWKQPLRWNADILTVEFERPRVFPSLCDWLDDEVPIEWLADFLDLIRRTPNLDWLLLTKRPENFMGRICGVFEFTGQDEAHFTKWKSAHLLCEGWISEGSATQPPPNVWLGVSVENQDAAEARVSKLLETPAAVRFLSVEPLLGPVNLRAINATPSLTFDALAPSTFFSAGNLIDWVIVGGESGPKARPCDVRWIDAIAAQCRAATVPVFVKQLGSRPVIPGEPIVLQDRKGGDPSEWPEDLRVRQFPTSAFRLPPFALELAQ